MKILFVESSWQDYLFWQEHDQVILRKINELIKDIQRDPYRGLGKPEPLKFNLSGFWSRRINHEHRLVYKIDSRNLYIAQCRYHY